MLRYHMELRGLGIINIKDLFGIAATRVQKDLDLVVELEYWKDDGVYDRLGLDDQAISILGVPVPYLLMPVGAGRNVTILLEVAVRNLLLKRQGIHTARTFARRLQDAMEPKRDDYLGPSSSSRVCRGPERARSSGRWRTWASTAWRACPWSSSQSSWSSSRGRAASCAPRSRWGWT